MKRKNILVILLMVGCCAFWIYAPIALVLAFEYGMAQTVLDNIWLCFLTAIISLVCITFAQLIPSKTYW